ncbi:MAG: WD40 repeat domain-containing protein [Candidatus Hodarchaeota archaeon]
MTWSFNTNSGDDVFSVAISADGQYIIAGCEDNHIYFFNNTNSTPIWSYEMRPTVTKSVNYVSVDISADGQYMVASREYVNKSPSYTKGDIFVFNKTNSTPLWIYESNNPITQVAISADGQYIVSGEWGGAVRLFNKDSNSTLWTCPTIYSVSRIAISADSNYIVAGAGYNILLLARGGPLPLTNYTTNHGIKAVSISDDGEYFVGGCGWKDGNVYLFNRTYPLPLWSRNIVQVETLSISGDGRYIAAGSTNYNVYMFNRNSSKVLWYHHIRSYSFSIDLSADGYYMVSGSLDLELFCNNYTGDKTSFPPLIHLVLLSSFQRSSIISISNLIIITAISISIIIVFIMIKKRL